METSIDIKKRIHAFVDHADERILRIFNAIIISEEADPTFPESFLEELEDRKLRHLKGESKSYIWSEVKDRARSSLK